MSKYTTEVRYICENAAGLTDSVGFDNIDDVLTEETVAKVFKGIEYPIFDENYRYVLNKKILLTYYTREICAETVGLWKLQMRQVLNNIMPFYNQLYNSELLVYKRDGTLNINPFHDKDIRRDGEHKTINKKTDMTGDITDSGHNAGDGNSRYSDTPQGTLVHVEDNTYLTNATFDHSYVENYNKKEYNRHDNTNGTESYWETIIGKDNSNSYASLLKEFRETFLNIDKMILEELKPCFFGLW